MNIIQRSALINGV